jgi:hypothetical protein
VAIGWAWGRGFKLQILNFKLQGRGGGLGVKEILDSGFWMVELDEEIRTANSHEFSRIRKIFGSGSESPIYNFCFLFPVFCFLFSVLCGFARDSCLAAEAGRRKSF